MIIKKAAQDQYPDIRAFYFSIIDQMAELPYGAEWKKDIYPAPAFLQESLRDGNFYIGEESGRIVAAMVVDHHNNEGYRQINWLTKADDPEVSVIHILAVDTPLTRQGYGKQMVRFVIDKAREEGQKAIRLDVLKGNLPAEKLYPALGFQYVQTVPMYYEDTGWADFELYEYPL